MPHANLIFDNRSCNEYAGNSTFESLLRLHQIRAHSILPIAVSTSACSAGHVITTLGIQEHLVALVVNYRMRATSPRFLCLAPMFPNELLALLHILRRQQWLLAQLAKGFAMQLEMLPQTLLRVIDIGFLEDHGCCHLLLALGSDLQSLQSLLTFLITRCSHLWAAPLFVQSMNVLFLLLLLLEVSLFDLDPRTSKRSRPVDLDEASSKFTREGNFLRNLLISGGRHYLLVDCAWVATLQLGHGDRRHVCFRPTLDLFDFCRRHVTESLHHEWTEVNK